jgi:dTDP-4-amino-4,6-dideoxygalactose transaminase
MPFDPLELRFLHGWAHLTVSHLRHFGLVRYVKKLPFSVDTQDNLEQRDRRKNRPSLLPILSQGSRNDRNGTWCAMDDFKTTPFSDIAPNKRPVSQPVEAARPMRKDFLVFGAPAIGEEEIDEVAASLRSGWLGTGPKVARFEAEFAAYKNVSSDRVAALNSCTAALHVSLIASGVGPGDEVVTTAMTFCATVNAIIHSGATPVIVDIDPVTLNIDPERVEAAITPATKAIVPVHFAGRPCDMPALMDIAQKYRLKVIEDCAHAIETERAGRKAGTWGDFGCFSFYVTKNVATGEGGMVIARKPEDIARVKMLALHGMTKDAWHRFGDSGFKHYQVAECGFKYNMMDLQAAIGIHQLARVDRNWERRQQVWATYQQALADLPLRLPADPEPPTRHAHHLYTVLVDEARADIRRDAFLDALTRENIGAGVHYLSIPEHPFYQSRYGWHPEDCPNAMQVGRSTLSLPLSAALSDADIDDVVHAVRSVLEP